MIGSISELTGQNLWTKLLLTDSAGQRKIYEQLDTTIAMSIIHNTEQRVGRIEFIRRQDTSSKDAKHYLESFMLRHSRVLTRQWLTVLYASIQKQLFRYIFIRPRVQRESTRRDLILRKLLKEWLLNTEGRQKLDGIQQI